MRTKDSMSFFNSLTTELSNPQLSFLYTHHITQSVLPMAPPKGLEPPTLGLEILRLLHLVTGANKTIKHVFFFQNEEC